MSGAGDDLLRKYRLPGECDDCATEAAALATGYNPVGNGGWREACENPDCRFYDANYAAAMAALTADDGPSDHDTNRPLSAR